MCLFRTSPHHLYYGFMSVAALGRDIELRDKNLFTALNLQEQYFVSFIVNCLRLLDHTERLPKLWMTASNY